MLKLLKTFKVVYEVKNFSQAADLLFISQSTVSIQIKQLEAILNTQLFIRNGRREIQPTSQATSLYHSATHLLGEWETIYKQIQHSSYDKQCSIAVSQTFATKYLATLIIDLFENFPTIHFSIKTMNSMDIFEHLKNKQIQIGIVEKPLSDFAIKRTPLMRDQLVLVGNTQKGPWLIREENSGVYFYTRQYLNEQNIHLPTIEINNNDTILKLIAQGFGCSILSKSICQDIPFIELDEKFHRSFYLIEKEEHSVQVNIDQIVTFILNWASKQ